jgi:hypothetical protein
VRYLKEKIINYLCEYPQLLDMTESMGSYTKTQCKFDLAGHILRAAGYHLQVGDSPREPKLPLNAPLLDKKWVEFEASLGTDGVAQEIAGLARQIWEEEYGEREAQELPFYDSGCPEGMPMVRYWDCLDSVNASDIIEFLQGDMNIYKLNGPDDKAEDD